MNDAKGFARVRPGFVLPLAMTFVVIAALVVASVFGYVASAARFTREAVIRDRCRFAAQSVVEQAKLDVQEGFSKFISDNFSSIQIAPRKARAFNWFDTVSTDRRTVGNPSPVRIFGEDAMPVSVDGCRVWVGIGDTVEHEPDGAVAVVPIVATAECDAPGGKTVSVTVAEWVVFGTDQSKVFDNAYFVNNYGWMSGNFTINGEFRANGNVSLTQGAVVNGFIYAAPNSEVGAQGVVTVSSSSIDNQSDYRRNAGSRSRYDTGNLDEMGSYDAARSSGAITAATYDSRGNLTGGSRTAGNPAKAIVNQTQTIAGQLSTVDPVPMPFVSDLDPYVEFAQDEGGTLSYPSVTYTDSTGASRTVPGATINAHRSLATAGPSGDASLADAGSVLLVGTQSNPIRINGPVVIDGDVIIKGFVSGQGTIYAGRNVHVIGDIRYANAPSWSHNVTGDAARREHASNESRDMLGIVAKGNVVVGDSTSSSIAGNVNSGSNIAYSCDPSDSLIGYPSLSYSTTRTTSTRYGTTQTRTNTFNGDYTATEQINGMASGVAAPGGYDSASGRFGKVRTTTEKYTVTEPRQQYVALGYGRGYYQTVYVNVEKTRTVLTTTYDRCFYETVCDNAIINSLKSTVGCIDAIIYNNHGVFGSLGANFQINGALVCRDEGLTANGGTFNWDMRLRRTKNSQVVDAMGLPKGPGDPYSCRWMELPDQVNPVYRAAKGISR